MNNELLLLTLRNDLALKTAATQKSNRAICHTETLITYPRQSARSKRDEPPQTKDRAPSKNKTRYLGAPDRGDPCQVIWHGPLRR